jgi:hypothetical protein
LTSPPSSPAFDPTQTNIGGIIAQAAAAGQQQEGDKRGKKRKERNGAKAAKQYNKNKSMVDKFKMKENKVWKRDLVGKNLKDRPKWNDKSWMCVRWFTNGNCFKDCNNKDSHVCAQDVPANKKAAYIKFLDRVRGGKWQINQLTPQVGVQQRPTTTKASRLPISP